MESAQYMGVWRTVMNSVKIDEHEIRLDQYVILSPSLSSLFVDVNEQTFSFLLD